MKSLNIQIPEGYEIDKDLSTFEKIVFKPIPKVDPEQILLDLWKSATLIKYSRDNCRTYCLPNGDWMFQQDFNYKKLYYSYYRVYNVLKEHLSQSQINELVMKVLSKDINCDSLEADREGGGRVGCLNN